MNKEIIKLYNKNVLESDDSVYLNYIKINEITEIHLGNIGDNKFTFNIWLNDEFCFGNVFSKEDTIYRNQYEEFKKQLLELDNFVFSKDGDKDSEHIYNIDKISCVSKSKDGKKLYFYKTGSKDQDYFTKGTEEYSILCKRFGIDENDE